MFTVPRSITHHLTQIPETWHAVTKETGYGGINLRPPWMHWMLWPLQPRDRFRDRDSGNEEPKLLPMKVNMERVPELFE